MLAICIVVGDLIFLTCRADTILRQTETATHNEALLGIWGNKGIYFSRTKRSKNEGNRRTKAILGNREHRKKT